MTMESLEQIPNLLRGEQDWPYHNFLILGHWDGLARTFLAAGWRGVMVVPPGAAVDLTDPIYKTMELVKVNVAQDSHFRKLMSGEYVKATTIKELFDRWGGPFDMIAVSVPMQSRQIWYSDSVQAALPRMYILPEDGHNEFVLERAMDRGYMKMITEEKDMLILVHK